MSENQEGQKRPGYINPVIAKAEQRAIMKAKLGLLFLLILGVITITTAALVLLLNEVDSTFRKQVSDPGRSVQYVLSIERRSFLTIPRSSRTRPRRLRQ